jgi:hypothetical protein
MAGKPTENQVRIYKAHEWSVRLRTLFRCAGAVGVAYYVYKTVETIAGTTTTFTVILNVLAKFSADRWIAIAVATLCGCGWAIERKARKGYIKRSSSRIKELEEKLWPGRSSSGIQETGEGPKDED